jgi:3-hydroxyacyl-CoA dehydrogenase
MTPEQIENGLKQLGFPYGWATLGDEITIWNIDAPKPTIVEVLAAAKRYEENQAKAAAESEVKRQALLDRLGITEEEAKLLLA